MKNTPLLQESFNSHKLAVVIPTYNNIGTLAEVINGVLKYTSNIIVVNDGSTDGTKELLESYLKNNSLHLVSYSENRGKGWALRQGFTRSLQLGYEFVITIDSDGQHFPEDLEAFIHKLEEKGTGLIIGARNMNQSSVPGKSSFGNRFSNFWFWVETGIKAPDTQSGYRLYPVKLMEGTRYFTRKFEFEIEVIVRAAWKGIPIESVPVKVYYAPPDERVSHFRPFRDFTRISILNTVLVLITLLWINPRNFTRAVFSKSTYTNLLKEMFNPDEPVSVTAFSVAFGVFMGIVPVWGFQLLIAIALSVLLRLNKALVIVSANISIPPMIPFIIFLSYQMGVFWVGDGAIPFSLSKDITLESIHANFLQYVYGAITLAIVAGLGAGLITFSVLKFKKRKQSKELS